MSTNSIKVSKVKLPLDEQIELGRRMTELGDASARDTLILSCVPIVIAVAKGFSKNSQISYDDLFQEGMLGVMEAIDKYDYRRNTRFTSFAYTRIIHNLAFWVKKQIRDSANSGSGRVSGIIMSSTIDSFRTVFQTYPTDTQLAKLLSTSPEDVAYQKKHYANPVPSTFRIYSCDTEEIGSPESDVSTIVEKTLCNKYNQKHIHDAIQTLEPMDRIIVFRRFLYEEKKSTLEDLGAELGVNPSTISRREKKALKHILEYFEKNGIEPIF